MEEEGSFPTLERTSQGSVLKKTSPRNFGPADPHFTDSRGVVLFDKKTKEEVKTQNIISLFDMYLTWGRKP